MTSKFEFQFKNINSVRGKTPICRINLNGEDVHTGTVNPLIIVDSETKEKNTLKIFFENKDGRDTLVNSDNQIIQDLNFELEKITIDGVNLKHLIWESKYVTDKEHIESCLFFGPKGFWVIDFESPILKWVLKTNHKKNKNDPTWELDYNYYKEACQKLSKIQTR